MINSLIILKIGGKVLEDQQQLLQLLKDFSLLEGAKLLVHGGGKAGTDIAAKLGVETIMHEGRRITHAEMLEVALMVYGGLMNKQLVAQLQALGMNALGLTGADLNVILSKKRAPKPIDFGFVGDVTNVNASQLTRLLHAGILPVMAPLTHNGHGQMLNTNADTIASRVAGALGNTFEVSLVYCLERPGVLTNPDDDNSVIPQINRTLFQELKANGAIIGGMIPKLKNAFDALDDGVKEVLICDPTGVGKVGSPAYTGTVVSE